MKRNLFVIVYVFAGLLVSCTSNEEKADKLIKQYMFENLYDYQSYEPTKTQVDTLYSDVFLDKDVIAIAYRAYDCLNKVAEHMEKAEDIKEEVERMEQLLGRNSFAKTRIDMLKNKYEENISKANKMKKEAFYNLLYILDANYKAKQIKEEMLGWKVTHKFRCNTRGGYLSLGEYVFLVDRDFTEIFDTIIYDEEYLTAKEMINVALQSDRDAILTEIQNLEE